METAYFQSNAFTWTVATPPRRAFFRQIRSATYWRTLTRTVEYDMYIKRVHSIFLRRDSQDAVRWPIRSHASRVKLCNYNASTSPPLLLTPQLRRILEFLYSPFIFARHHLLFLNLILGLRLASTISTAVHDYY